MNQFARLTPGLPLAWVVLGGLSAGCGNLGGAACSEGTRVDSSQTTASLDGNWRLTIADGSPAWAFADGACLSVEQQIATAWQQDCQTDILGGSFEARAESGLIELETVVRVSGVPRVVRLVLSQQTDDERAGRILLFGEGGTVQACASVTLSPG
jgi:hypothetical protein